jgi:DNA-binding NtrC family response regulator
MHQSAFQIATSHASETTGPIVLVVEKGWDIASQAIDRLQVKGIAVERTDDGKQALQMLAEQVYALVMIDSAVDGRQGLALLEQITCRTPDIPVVITTGAATVKHAVAAMQNGAADYLMKPVSAEAFEACVVKIVGRGRGAAAEPAQKASDEEKPFVTASPAVEQILTTARSVADSKATVLITGESGTGKEVLATYIHRHAHRAHLPYVAVNCAALPETLMESELFGFEKGAFTGALQRKRGKFELAGSGTLVLDEISEMPLGLQAKLLRVLQERRIDRIGSDRCVAFEAQVIAISNRDLGECVRRGQLREDLYYRINVIPLHLPPLRERPHDIPLLVTHFAKRFSRLHQRPPLSITPDSMADLKKRDWKGNIRELENTIERAVLIGALSPAARQEGLPGEAQISDADPLTIRPGLSVKDVEEALIKQTLNEVNDHREKAARMLGISVRTLRNKLNEYRKRTERLEKDPSS